MAVTKKSVDSKTARAIGRALLAWYVEHRRDLPWRRSLDPYSVWVSEMMLQQTQVATVIPYFQRWMQRFPDVAALASATESDVLHAWQGLGYYSRARNLQRAAVLMVREHAGRVPDAVEALLALPGIGPYSAGAIASIAYGKAEPLVDGNVIRVLCRVFALRGDPNKNPLKTELWAHARALVPAQEPGDFNQALMELGATVCSPRSPRCEICPLIKLCQARAQDVAELLPELPARAKPTAVHMVAAIATRAGRVLVTKLNADAPRWASMWLFPNAELTPAETPEAAVQRALLDASGLHGKASGIVCVVRHTVTRFRITLDAYRTVELSGSARAKTAAELAWKSPAELSDLAMPAAHRTIATRLLDT
ncbi:MAG TPA: A/G-specific adenine glycosylase [Polyangiaceae bacterium]|jgi:A/G-specific adenine glycosylase|nr:A/G-specific adenine glycosylase [Polyangiaceae bacterium]